MPKKASTERGYMTKKEVYSKLDGLKTERDKIEYLDEILSKRDLLAPRTYRAVQELASEVYSKAAVEAAKKGGPGVAGELLRKRLERESKKK